MIMGEWDKSEKYFNEALTISQKQNLFQEISRSYYYLGLFHLNKEEYSRAREFYENAVEVCEKAGSKQHVMTFSHGVIWTSIELGALEKAKELIDKINRVGIEDINQLCKYYLDLQEVMIFSYGNTSGEGIENFKIG